MVLNPINPHGKLPWGWHFHPTDAELIINLKAKLSLQRQERLTYEPEDFPEQLREIDLSKVEPWDIKDEPEHCPIRSAHSDPSSQFFYTRKGQKYRHGNRNNRATTKGFWKATGRDKRIYDPYSPRRPGVRREVIGHRKALVFYSGRAPNGSKTDYILHEYRLENGSNAHDEQWVACHMFIKERNDSRNQDPGMAILSPDLQQQQQEQQQQLLLQQYQHQHQQHMHVPPIKEEEAAYMGMPYTSGGPPSYRQTTNPSAALMEYPNISSSSMSSSSVLGNGLDLPQLEEVSVVSPYRAANSSDGPSGQIRAMLGNLPSFNDGNVPPCPESIYLEALPGYGDQFQVTDDNILWQS